MRTKHAIYCVRQMLRAARLGPSARKERGPEDDNAGVRSEYAGRLIYFGGGSRHATVASSATAIPSDTSTKR
jgi:hypothetical protein